MIPKSGYRFSERSCSTNKLERDDDSKKSHLALAGRLSPLDPTRRVHGTECLKRERPPLISLRLMTCGFAGAVVACRVGTGRRAGRRAPCGLRCPPLAARLLRSADALAMALEHDPEKWIPVFGKDHAPTIT